VKDPEQLLDIQQAAQFLHVSETSLRRWTNSGRLACLRVGGKRERRFRRADLVAFMEHQPVSLEHQALPQNPHRSDSPDRTQAVIAGIPVTHGTHLCAVDGNDAGRSRLAVAFLADGLRPGNVCYLLASPEPLSQILSQLEAGRGSLQPDIDSGQLVIPTYQGSAREQCDYWERTLGAATKAGAVSLRVAGDMAACLDAGMSLEEVAEYESRYDRTVAARFPAVTLCMYDVRRFESLEVVEALKSHKDMFRYPPERLFA
jgi:transcriptional repressor of dcmA and dcmR